jgi:hypothetical protein
VSILILLLLNNLREILDLLSQKPISIDASPPKVGVATPLLSLLAWVIGFGNGEGVKSRDSDCE